MPWSFFGRKEPSAPPSKLPRESYLGLHLETDGKTDVWLVNTALIAFPEKALFPWRLSIIIEMEETHEIGLPTAAEQRVLGGLGTALSALLKENDNAVFVGSGSCNGMRQMLYHIRDPEAAHRALTAFVASPAATRAMEYRMDQDAEWTHAGIYLEAARGA